MSVLGDRIRIERKARHMTQKELANKAGLSTMSIQRYENGERKPNVETLGKIADALDVELGLLMFPGAEKIRQGFRREIDLQRYAESVEAGRPDLLSVYNSLNTAGQDRVYDYAADLATMPKYQAAPPEDPEE